MKRYIAGMLVCLLCVSLFTGCSASGNNQETQPKETEEVIEVEALSKDKEYNILFVGNSYTYYNDMPTAYFGEMAKSCGYHVNVTAVTKGGHKLSAHADPADPYGERVAVNLSAPGAFDYVILQEQSVLPATNPEAFYAAVRTLAEKARAVGAKPILYATWGRKDGSKTLTDNGMTNESMTWRLAAAYEHIGKELDIPVIFVGLAFRDVYMNSAIELYNDDLSHPSANGSYLAGMALFSGIFKVLPMDIAFSGNLTKEDADTVRKAVTTAVFRTPEIPQEYQESAKAPQE